MGLMGRGTQATGLGMALLVFAACAPAAAQTDRLAKLRAEFESAQDPAEKAKKATKLGDAQMEKMHQAVRAGNYEEALNVVEEYRDTVKTAFRGLKESARDAEKKPAGFKQLQIHIRRAVKKIKDASLALPFEMRDGVNGPIKELNEIEAELINLLFPRQPGRVPEKKKEGGE